MNAKRMNPVAYFCITFFFGLFGVHHFIDGKIGMGILYLFTAGIFGFGWLVDIIKAFIAIFDTPSKTQYTPSGAYYPDSLNSLPPPPRPEPVDGTEEYGFSPIYRDGECLAYEYDETVCCINGIVPEIHNCGGFELKFVQEPENEHDPAAVAIWLDDLKLGYVYRGQTQDMINDWIKKGGHFDGFVNLYSPERITYKIGFWKPLEEMPKKKCKITSSSDFLMCEAGDELSFDFDFSDCEYTLTDPAGNKIGVISSLYNYADINGLEPVTAKVLSTDIKSNGKSVIEFDVYFRKAKQML